MSTRRASVVVKKKTEEGVPTSDGAPLRRSNRPPKRKAVDEEYWSPLGSQKKTNEGASPAKRSSTSVSPSKQTARKSLSKNTKTADVSKKGTTVPKTSDTNSHSARDNRQGGKTKGDKPVSSTATVIAEDPAVVNQGKSLPASCENFEKIKPLTAKSIMTQTRLEPAVFPKKTTPEKCSNDQPIQVITRPKTPQDKQTVVKDTSTVTVDEEMNTESPTAGPAVTVELVHPEDQAPKGFSTGAVKVSQVSALPSGTQGSFQEPTVQMIYVSPKTPITSPTNKDLTKPNTRHAVKSTVTPGKVEVESSDKGGATFTEPDTVEAIASASQPGRRKRVASELLQAAEIAHCLLDGQPHPWERTPGGESETERGVTQEQSVSAKDNEPDQTDVSMKTNVSLEKISDKVFDGVTAIVKNRLVTNDKVKDFVLNRLPKLTGVSAVISPSSHYLLHGSWLSILRARKSLDRYVMALETLTIENTSVKKDAIDVREETVTTASVSSKEPEKLYMAEDIPNSTSLDVTVETLSNGAAETEEYEEGEISRDLLIPLGAGRVKGLDRSLLTGSVEVYKDDADDSPMFLCSMCGFSSNTQAQVTQHIKNRHSDKSFRCNFCSVVFPAKQELEQHLKSVHPGQVAKYTCEICSRQFADKRYLATHIKRHTGIKNHECMTCGRKFFEKHKLKWHMETHKPFEAKKLPYNCTICDKKFYNRSSLSDHQNIHTGARPFECNLCDASFSHRIGLKRHMMVHDESKPFACNTCGKSFKTVRQMESHEAQHSGGSKYMCQICLRGFATQYSLKRHLPICMKRPADHNVGHLSEAEDSAAVDTITDHEANGNEETVFMCGVCDQLFPSLEEAADHARNHTSEDIQLEVEGEGMMPEGYTVSRAPVAGDSDSAIKLLNAMTSQEPEQELVIQEVPVQMDDTHLVANTLADLSALGQAQLLP